MKIAVNREFGGFSLSQKAYEKLGFEWDDYGFVDNKMFGIDSSDYHAYRTDHRLIQVIEELGTEASGQFANVQVIEIPDDVEWEISDYDGWESIHEVHRSW